MPTSRKYNFLPLVIVSWIMIIYLIATHNFHWYVWVFVAITVVERLALSLTLWIEAQMLRAMANQMMQQQQGQNPMLGGPPNAP